MTDSIHILNGLPAILNPENIKPGVDPDEVARSLVNGGLNGAVTTTDPQDRFNEELKATAKRLGISFGEFLDSPAETGGAPSANTFGANTFGANTFGADYSSSAGDNTSEDGSSDEEEDGEDISEGEGERLGSFPAAAAATPTAPPWKSERNLEAVTMEQQRRAQIDDVMNEFSGSSNDGFSFENEKREDIKCAMLEEIDWLLNSLMDENIDVSRIPKVGPDSPFNNVSAVLKILRHKHDRIRYCTLAEEFILFGAGTLEDLFDGETVWFGKYKPDLTGWSSQVNVKLHRMRHDTSTLMSNIMHDYDIGPSARILMELVPNAFLYSKSRKKKAPQGYRCNDTEIANLSSKVREM